MSSSLRVAYVALGAGAALCTFGLAQATDLVVRSDRTTIGYSDGYWDRTPSWWHGLVSRKNKQADQQVALAREAAERIKSR